MADTPQTPYPRFPVARDLGRGDLARALAAGELVATVCSNRRHDQGALTHQLLASLHDER